MVLVGGGILARILRKPGGRDEEEELSKPGGQPVKILNVRGGSVLFDAYQGDHGIHGGQDIRYENEQGVDGQVMKDFEFQTEDFIFDPGNDKDPTGIYQVPV